MSLQMTLETNGPMNLGDTVEVICGGNKLEYVVYLDKGRKVNYFEGGEKITYQYVLEGCDTFIERSCIEALEEYERLTRQIEHAKHKLNYFRYLL